MFGKIIVFFRQILDHVTDRVLVVVGMLMFSQIPVFMNQYTQRLGGHFDEIVLHIVSLKKIAHQQNKSLEEYIKKFLNSTDKDFSSQGIFMHRLLGRKTRLQNHLIRLKESTGIKKLGIFLYNLDFHLARTTFQNFEPAILLTGESVVYGLIGILFLLISYHFIFKVLLKRLTTLLHHQIIKKPSPA